MDRCIFLQRLQSVCVYVCVSPGSVFVTDEGKSASVHCKCVSKALTGNSIRSKKHKYSSEYADLRFCT